MTYPPSQGHDWRGALPGRIMRRLIDDLGLRDITIIYGMTETLITTQTRATTPLNCVSPRWVGCTHIEVKIVDLEGRTVPRGIQGEICARGYSVMQGYWNGAEQTAEAIDRARWMHTGDLGVMDASGYLAVTGRSKDMVIRGGRTSIRGRWRSSFTAIRRLRTCKRSAYPIHTLARNCAPGSS